MKFRTQFATALLLATAGFSTVQAQTDLYWDVNTTTDGFLNAGSYGDGTWDNVTTSPTNTIWNTDATGGAGGAFQAWDDAAAPLNNAIINAEGGAPDASEDAIVTVATGTRSANNITFGPNAWVSLGGAGLLNAAGSISIEAGTKVSMPATPNKAGAYSGNWTTPQLTIKSGAELVIDTTLRLAGTGGTITLQGGTLNQGNPGSAGSFISATKSLQIDGSGTVYYNGGGGGCNCTIYTPNGTNAIIGNGTLTKTGAGEFRYNGPNQALTTYTKLVVEEGLFRLGFATSGHEQGFGAVPASFTQDAITINGGAIGASFGITMNANRGVTIGSEGAWFNNAAASMVIPTSIAGTGALRKDIDPSLIKGSATGAGSLFLTSPTGSAYEGGTYINAGNLKVTNTSGSGTGTGAVEIGGSSATQYGTLFGSGIIGGHTTVKQFGEMRPTSGSAAVLDGAGTFTFAGGLTLNAGSLLTYQYGSTGNDLAVVGGVNGLTISGPLNLDIVANGTVSAGVFPLFDYDTSFVGSVDDLVLRAVPAGDFTFDVVNNPTNSTIDLVIATTSVAGDINGDGDVNILDYVVGRMDAPGGTSQDLTDWAANYSGNLAGSGSASGSAVPEPSTIAMLVLGLAAVGIRRRGR